MKIRVCLQYGYRLYGCAMDVRRISDATWSRYTSGFCILWVAIQKRHTCSRKQGLFLIVVQLIKSRTQKFHVQKLHLLLSLFAWIQHAKCLDWSQKIVAITLPAEGAIVKLLLGADPRYFYSMDTPSYSGVWWPRSQYAQRKAKLRLYISAERKDGRPFWVLWLPINILETAQTL